MARKTTKLVRSYGGIAFDDDIILNVLEKTNYTEKQVVVVYNFLMQNIRKAIREPDRHMLLLPNIGPLYYKVEAARKYIDKLKHMQKTQPLSATQRERLLRFSKKIELFDEYFSEKTEGKSVFTRHKNKSFINNYFFRKGMTLKEVEEYQNQRKYEEKF